MNKQKVLIVKVGVIKSAVDLDIYRRKFVERVKIVWKRRAKRAKSLSFGKKTKKCLAISIKSTTFALAI